MTKQVQIGREDEQYAAPFKCLACKGTWIAPLGPWPPLYKFCPRCGVPIAEALLRPEPPPEKYERFLAVAERSRRSAPRRVSYEVEYLSPSTVWRREVEPTTCRHAALRAWRERLAAPNFFLPTQYRLVAHLARGPVVVLGPTTVPANDDQDQ